MASIFKPIYLRPIPDGATRCKLGGDPAVRYSDERGKVHVRAIHRDRDGKLTDKMQVEQGRWWMRYSLPDGTERREKGFSDRAATEQEAARRERLAQQQAAGMVVVDEKHLSVNLSVHLAEYISTLKRRGRVFNYYDLSDTRLQRIFAGCGWLTLRDVNPISLEHYLSDLAEDGLSIKTVNDYLGIAKAFMKWCLKTRRIVGNALEGVDRIATGARENDKAALTPDQAKKLLAVAGHHRLLYMTALGTGLRRSELAALEWGDLHLDSLRPYVKLRGATTKARRSDTLPLRSDVVQALSEARPADAGAKDRIFASLPKMWTFRSALDRAGIPHYDDAGKKMCFHSLRVTYGTWLGQAGTAPRVHMELMRHTDMKLTMSYYTDPRLLDTAGAVAKLPSLDDGPSAERAKALRTGTYDVPEKVLTKSTSGSVRNGPQGAGTGDGSAQKALQTQGFSLEAPGIEPGSRDVSLPASTCIVAFLVLADRARSDTVRHSQDDLESRRRNHPTRRRQARCFSP